VKLLFYSHCFAPSIGGAETIAFSLARGLAEARTPGGLPEFNLTLVTEPPPKTLLSSGSIGEKAQVAGSQRTRKWADI